MLTASVLVHPPLHRTGESGTRIPLRPSETRLKVSRLIADQRLVQADTLSKELLGDHPSDEEALVTRILVCEVMHRWQEAAGLLRQLLELQGSCAPADSWLHYVRVLNCLGAAPVAHKACQSGLALHPGHPHLIGELERLDRDRPLVSLDDLSGASQ